MEYLYNCPRIKLYGIVYLQKGVEISHCVNFNPNGSGSEIWEDLWEDGQLNSEGMVNCKLCK